jgi:hypothetical protein
LRGAAPGASKDRNALPQTEFQQMPSISTAIFRLCDNESYQ